MAPPSADKKPKVLAPKTGVTPSKSASKPSPSTPSPKQKPASPSKTLSGSAKSSPSGASKSPVGKKVATTATSKKPATVKKAGANAAASSKKTSAAAPPAPAPPALSEEERARIAAEEEAARAAALAKAEAQMEELRQRAWVAQVEFERKEEAKRRKKAEEALKRKKEEAKLTKDMLEAAFDGEDDDVVAMLARADALGMRRSVDASDAHGNTLLSEAAAGGVASTVALLLERGADPNTRGEFGRSPLWRACFLGKEDVVTPLLQAGADPRIGNEQGELPQHVAGSAAIKEQLGSWDLAETDRLVATWQARQEEAKLAEAAQMEEAVRGAEDVAQTSKTECDAAQAALKHARVELEKRIYEHDICVEEGKSDELIQVTLEQIKSAEQKVETARERATAASRALDSARLALREAKASSATPGEGGDGSDLPGLPVEIKALDDVLIRDVGDKIKASGRWPLVIDTSGQASVFLRYLNTNYVNTLSSHNMEPNRLRRSILGGIRYGKPVVIDQMDVDLWDELPRLFDAVRPGLLQSLLDKTLLQNEGYTVLIKPEDGEEYDANKFQDERVAAFRMVFLCAAPHPNADMLQQMYPLRVVVRG